MSQRAAQTVPAASKTTIARAVVSQGADALPESDDAFAWKPDLQRLPANAAGGFAHLPAGAVIDADTQRRLVTERLIAQLAPVLGLDPRQIRIEVLAAGRARLDAAGARGLQEGSTIWLHPTLYRPLHPDGRYLLAHEATHAAQRKLSAPITSPVAAAETEAAAFGQDFAAGRLPRRPRFALVGAHAAADSGLAAAATQSAAPPALNIALIKESRAQDLALMIDALDGLWVSDGDVFDVLRALEPLSFLTQVTLVQALDTQLGGRLADNISSGHFKRYRYSVLAIYLAVTRLGQVNKLEDNPFQGMDWAALEPEEHYALREVITAFVDLPKGQSWYAGLKARHLQGYVDDVRGNVPNFNEAEQASKAAEQEKLRAEQIAQDKKLVKRSDVKGFLDEARDKLTYKLLDWAITDAEARALLDDVAKFVAEPAALRAIVDTLEGEGLMDRWVSNVPVSDLYTDAPITTPDAAASLSRRKVLLQLLVLRPAWKNALMAEKLLSYGLFDWAVTDEDAFLAFQLVKALPERVRTGFYSDPGPYAKRLDQEMSLSMKKGRAANFYTGGEDGGDLKSIKAQLLDDALWSKDKMSGLRQLIQMAIAADEGAWVFDQSKDRFLRSTSFSQLYQDAEFFSRVIRSFGLYVPKGYRRPGGEIDPGRESYLPEQLQGKPFGTDNPIWLYLIEGIGFIGHSRRVQIFRDSIGGEGLDFGEFQDMLGGSFLGAEFRRASQATGQERDELLDNSVRWDLDRGVLEMRAARVDIDNINFLAAGYKFQTAGVRVRGLHLHLEYPDKNSQRTTTSLRLRIDSAQFDDVMYIKAGSMLAVEQVAIDGLTVELLPDVASIKGRGPSDSVAIGAIFSVGLSNLLKISGTSDALKAGLFEPTTPLNLTITAAGLRVKGLATSSGQHIDQIQLDRVVLRTHSKKEPDYRAWLIGERGRLQLSLAELAASTAAAPVGQTPRHHVALDTAGSLRLQLQSVESELANFDEAIADRQRLRALEASQPLATADLQRLRRLDAYLADAGAGGMALDVGHAEARGIAGKVAMGDVTLDEVHGWGHSAGAALGALSGGSLTLNRMLRGPDYRGTLSGVESEGDPAGFVKLGDLHLAAVDVQGDIPTAETAAKDLQVARKAALKNPYDPRQADAVARLELRSRNAAVYWSTLEKTVIGTNDRQAFNTARNALLADRAFHADSISAKGALLEMEHQADGNTGVGLQTDKLDATGVEAAGVRVDAVHGDNLRLGGSLNGGLQALIGLGRNRDNLQGAAVSADKLQLSGIVHKYSGVRVEEVIAESLDAHAGFDQGRSALGLTAAKIQVSGLDWQLSERVLEMQRAKLVDSTVNRKPTKAEAAQLKDIDVLLGDIQASKAQLSEAVQQLANPKLGAAERRNWQDRQRDAESELAFWQRKVELKQLTVSDLNLDVKGLGNLLADDWSLSKAMGSDQGIAIGSGRADGQIASGISLQGGSMRTSAGEAKTTKAGASITAGGRVGVGAIETGPIRGSVTLKSDSVSIDDFAIDALTLNGINYAGGGMAVWSQGKDPSAVSGVRLSATLETPLVDAEKPDGDRYAAAIRIHDFKIAKIIADGLHYRNYKSGLRVDLSSGRLEGLYAKDTRIELPRTDNDVLLIKGGNAGFANTRNLQVAIATGSGMAVGSSLQTGSLAVQFASDGKVTADLQQLDAEGHLTQKDLDARFAGKSNNIHVELMPGAKGYADARQKFRASGLSIGADIAQGKPLADSGIGPAPNQFKFAAAGIDTGDILREPDGTVRAPELSVPLLSLDKLHFQRGNLVVDVSDGSPIELRGLTADITAEANPKAPEQRGKDESVFERIVIHSLTVPMIVSHGLMLTLHDADKGDIIISQSPDNVGLLKNLTLGGNGDKGEGFVIRPNANWQMFGKLGITQATLGGIGADLRAVLVDAIHADVDNINVGFFGSEDTVFSFDEATLRHLRGAPLDAGSDPGAGGDDLGSTIVSRLKRAGFALVYNTKVGPDAKVVLRGFKHDKTGTSLKSTELKGLRYTDPDMGLKLDVNSAVVPEGRDGSPGFTYTNDGKVRIRHAEINDADIEIADVRKLGGKDEKGKKANPAGSGLSFAPRLDLVDQISGHVNFTVLPFARGGGLASTGLYLAGPYAIRIGIQDGKVDFGKVEDESTGNLADFAVDINYVPGRADRGQLQLKIISMDPLWWNLDVSEAELASTGFVKLSTFLKHPLNSLPGDPKEPPKKQSFLDRVFFGNVDAHLTLPGKAHVELGNAGFLDLGGDSGTPGVVLDLTSAKVPAIKATIARFEANVARMQLKLDQKGTTLKTGAIHVGGVRNMDLFFVDQGVGPEYTDDDGKKTQNMLPQPQRLSGSITECSVDDLELQLAPDADKGKGSP